MEQFDKELAQQVVDTVKSVCGNDINYIDRAGIIFASTDAKRVGTFHEAGKKAASIGQIVEVYSKEEYAGSQVGVNFPFYYNGLLLAVIGITGNPDEVRKYARLAERITSLLTRERELHSLNLNQADKRHYVLNALLRGEHLNFEYLNSCLKELKIDLTSEKRLVLVKICSTNPSESYSVFDYEMRKMLNAHQIMLFAFYYPSQYVIVLEETQFQQEQSYINSLILRYQNVFRVTAGTCCSIYQLKQSYQTALTAMNSSAKQNGHLILFDDLILEGLFAGIAPEQKRLFLQKTIDSLSSSEKVLLDCYFKSNMSLLETSNTLFIHKNTLQYRLNVIARKTGFNPRHFREASILYLALYLEH